MKVTTSIFLVVTLGISSVTASAHEGHCEDTELGYAMSKMKKSFKKLRRELSDEDYTDAAKYTEELIALSRESLPLRPLKLKDDPNLSFEKYKQHMRETESLFENLLIAIKSEDEAAADNIMDSIKKRRKEGHEEFRKECD